MDSINSFFSNPIFSNYLGIVLTIIFGIIGIIATIYFSKQRMSKSVLEYYPRNGLRLYRDLAGTFDDLEIKYKNEIIKDNLMYMCGYLICRRHDIDVHYDNNGKNLNVIDIEVSNEDLVLKDIKVSTRSEKHNFTAVIDKDNPKKGTLSFEDFREEECVNILYLIQSKNNNISKPIIRFEHRIKDVENGVRMMSPIRPPIPLKYARDVIIKDNYLYAIAGVLLLMLRYIFGFKCMYSHTSEMISSLGFALLFITFIPFFGMLISNQKSKRIKRIVYNKHK